MANRKDSLQVPGSSSAAPATSSGQENPKNLLRSRSPKSSRGRPRNPSASATTEQKPGPGGGSARGKRGKRGEEVGLVRTLWRDLRGQSWFVPAAIALTLTVLGLLFLAISQAASSSTRDAALNRVVLQPQQASNTQTTVYKKRQPTSRPETTAYNPFAVPFKPKPKPKIVRPVVPNPKKVTEEMKEGSANSGEGFKSESGSLSGRAAAVMAKGYEDAVLERPVNPKAVVEEGEEPVAKSRTYEELKEAMRGYEGDDLTGLLNAAYRAVPE